MTIAAGFKCSDGIVLCADSEVGTDFEKHQESKIFTGVGIGNRMVVVTGAGWFDFIKMTADKIIHRTAHLDTVSDVEEIIEKTILEVFRNHIRYYPTHPKPDFSLIIAIRSETGILELLRTSETAITRVDKNQACTGSGEILANYLFHILSRSQSPLIFDEDHKLNPLSAVETSVLAAYILHQVKQHTTGCGQSSEIIIIPKQGDVRWIDRLNLQAMEFYLPAVIKVAQQCLLSCSNREMTAEQFEKHIKTFTATLTNLRQSYVNHLNLFRL